MLKTNYDIAYLILDEQTPRLLVSAFDYKPAKNHFLTDIVVEEHENNMFRIYGKKRFFDYHYDEIDPEWYDDLRPKADEYCIEEKDWYDWIKKPNRLFKLFGKKETTERCLKKQWYMHKTKIEEVVFDIYGGLIIEYKNKY